MWHTVALSLGLLLAIVGLIALNRWYDRVSTPEERADERDEMRYF